MNQTPTFSSILDRQLPTKVERPSPPPIGHYLAMVKGQYVEGKSSQKETPFIQFNMQLLQSAEDVDEDALKVFLKGRPLSDITLQNTFYATADGNMWRLEKFLLEDLKIKGGVSMIQALSLAPGRQCLITVKHESSQDNTTAFARITGTAPVEE